MARRRPSGEGQKRQCPPSAVTAVEERDGVQFHVERTSPFAPTKLIRTPGFRKNEPAPTDVQRTSA